MNGRTDSRTRSLIVLLALVGVGIACIVRLGYWQVLNHDVLSGKARDQVSVRVERAPVRGTVYDRTGTVVLATSVERDQLVAYPAQLKDDDTRDRSATRTSIGTILATILGLDATRAATLRGQIASGKAYVILARDLTPAQSAAVRSRIADGSLPQVRLEPVATRVYPTTGGAPKTTLASHLLGFVNREGLGQYGVEGRWQQSLAGSPTVILALRDGAGRPALETGEIAQPGTPGNDLVLTIDASLQLKVEQEVYAAWIADKAKSVSAVVMNPKTGEILASASYPGYDANGYRSVASRDPARFIDPVVSTVYEPGSVFKMVTAAAALDAGVVKRSTRIADQAVLELDGGQASVRNADRGSKGILTFQDGIAWSRNVVMSKVALRLGSTTNRAATRMYDAWTRLGFGRPTGIDLAGEVDGIARDPAVSPWRQIDLANGSFGQGVAVTLVQLATAYSAMVNGGNLPTPHVVASVGGKPALVAPARRVLSASLSRDLVAIMKRVVTAVPYYTARTQIPGYVVGGKTGTAQIWDAKKRAWRSDVYNFSFAGFVGRTSPELVIAVRVTEGRPVVNRPGNLQNPVESFELFRRIATDAMSSLDLPPVGKHTTRSTAGSRTPARTTPVKRGGAATPRPSPAGLGAGSPTASPRATARP